MECVKNILNEFEKFRMPATQIDQYETGGKMALAKQICGYVKNNKPIEFVILGYPMKSPNARDKVLGVLPDFGEQVSMQNFSAFNASIKQHYQPGINLTIISDGYVFGDVVSVSDKVVAAYEEATVEMTKIAPVQWYNLTDFYSKKSTLKSLRDKLTQQFGITDAELEHRILFDADVNALYKGMIRFMELDLAIHTYDSGNQLHKAAKRTAREMMLRNEAYSALIATEFADYIRLSMHPSTNTKKFSYQLIPGQNAHHSPWHGVVVKNGNEFFTMHKRDAEAAGYRLEYYEGRPFNYITQ
jgi:pyoverdine/dityrosine biosynthesis protein Dit1